MDGPGLHYGRRSRPFEVGVMLSWTEQIRQAGEKLTRHERDPLVEKVTVAVRGMEAISTAALLDLIGLPNTTSNARRISKTMRPLGFVPIKSRRFMPGGWCDTVTRGWARPIRAPRRKFQGGDKVKPCYVL